METEEKINILAVDDHPEKLLVIESILSDLEVNIIKANSGREALRYLLNQDVAVILLDVYMPEMDGFETARLIRERKRSEHTPIIFVTAADIDGTMASTGYLLGAVDYLTAPIIPEILKAKVRVFVDLFKASQEVKHQAEHLQTLNKELEKEITNRKVLEEELLRSQRELEGRVEERTSELLKINQRLRVEVIEHEKIGAALRQSEEKFAKIFRSSPDAIMITRLTDGCLAEVNEAFSRLTGYQKDEVIDHTTLELNLWADPAEREKYVELVREHGRVTNFEMGFSTKSGEVRDALASSEVIEIAGEAHMANVVRDITERKKTEEALRESQERLELTIKSANVGLWDWDLKTNKVYFSWEWKRQIGYEDHEITNDFSEWQSRVHPDDLDRILSTIQAYLKNPWPNYEVEFRFRHKDGSYRWILTQSSLLMDDDGKPYRMLGSHMDITERKRMEDDLRKLNIELEQRVAERTAELKRLVDLMSGREVRMAELKEVIRQLRTQLKEVGLVPIADDSLLGNG